MKIRGVASTRDVDSDQEILEPDGFVLDKFLKSGFFNYNHKSATDPTAIIGEPTDAYIKGGSLYVEGELYPESKKAVDLWDTIQVVHKGSKNRRFGFSIEGRALERDPLNEKRITKALITGCAVTPTPKNPSTLLEVMKGEGAGDPVYEVIKSEVDPNGGKIEYIVDIIDEKGNRITVDKKFNINIKKMTTADMRPVYPESVEGTKKKKVKDNVTDDFFQKNEKKFSKSEVYSKIFTIFTPDIEKAKQIYSLIERLESLKGNQMKKEISQETIDKAVELIDIVEDEKKGDEVKKSENEELEGKKKEEEEDVEKMEKALDEYEGKVAELKMKIGAAKGVKQEDQGLADENGGQIQKKGDEDDLKKGEDEEDEVKKEESAKKSEEAAKEETIVKSEGIVGDFIQKSEINDILKSFQDNLNEKFKTIGELYLTSKEGQEETANKIEEIQKSFDAINEKIDLIANSPAEGRKAIITKSYIDKFEKENPDVKVYSISTQKTELINKIYELSNIEKGEIDNVDTDYEVAFRDLEIAGTFSNPHVLDKLKKEQNIVVVN
jgi:hypothetical protein